MITIVLGGLDAAFRRTLGAAIEGQPELEIVGETAAPAYLYVLVATLRPSLLVLESRWAQACPDLLDRLLARPAPPKILLLADTPSQPELLAAVKQGVHGCVLRDAPATTWHRAILAVDAGEPWIPRALLAAALADLKHLLQLEPPASPGLQPLTHRQREIVRWAAQGLSNKEIGRHLGISPTTVKTHLHNIFERSGVSGRRQLVRQALDHSSGARLT